MKHAQDKSMLFTLIKSSKQHKKESTERQPEQALSLCLFCQTFLDKPETLPGCENNKKRCSIYSLTCQGYGNITVE